MRANSVVGSESEKDAIISALREENQLLRTQVSLLQQQIEDLKRTINLLRNGRNSRNSSLPPSHDLGRSNNKSLREPSSRKAGGQPGHEGSTLEMSACPDKVEEYYPVFCQCCGDNLPAGARELSTRRQEIIIPPVVPQYIEHRSYKAKCAGCGHETEAKMPSHLKANIQYGMEVNALVNYLNVRQYLPYSRTCELMRDLFGITLSEGTIANMTSALAEKARPAYEHIRQQIGKAEVVGGDETGIKVNGRKSWINAFQSGGLTFLFVSCSRSYEAITSYFKDGFASSVYVSDSYAAQLKIPAKHHQLCMAHLLRELNNFTDALSCDWSGKIKVLFKQAIALKKEMLPADYTATPQQVKELENQLDLLLGYQCQMLPHKKVRAFKKRLNKHRGSIFTFLYHQKVPPDNNASENAIRMAKVKMKVSAQFRSKKGADNFAVIRSVMDTAIKNTQNVWQAFNVMANYAAE